MPLHTLSRNESAVALPGKCSLGLFAGAAWARTGAWRLSGARLAPAAAQPALACQRRAACRPAAALGRVMVGRHTVCFCRHVSCTSCCAARASMLSLNSCRHIIVMYSSNLGLSILCLSCCFVPVRSSRCASRAGTGQASCRHSHRLVNSMLLD